MCEHFVEEVVCMVHINYVFRSERIYSFQHMYMKWYLHIDVNQKNGKQSTLAILSPCFHLTPR